MKPHEWYSQLKPLAEKAGFSVERVGKRQARLVAWLSLRSGPMRYECVVRPTAGEAPGELVATVKKAFMRALTARVRSARRNRA